MKKSNVIPTKEYVSVSDKKVFSFKPKAYGVLMKSIFTGQYIIAEHNRIVPLTIEQADEVIEINFNWLFLGHLS